MDQEQWAAVDQYFCDALVGHEGGLDDTLARSHAAGLPAINVAPNQGKFLHLLARLQNARRILEIGTLAGYSSIWLARALPSDGILVTLEANPDYAALARRNVDDAGVGDKVSIVVGLALDSLKKMVAEEIDPFDMVFIDADKENNARYLELVLKLSRSGTLIVGDNVVRRGRVVDAGNLDPDVVGTRRFIEQLASEPRLASTAIQTVGSKGWDGFSMSIVS